MTAARLVRESEGDGPRRVTGLGSKQPGNGRDDRHMELDVERIGALLREAVVPEPGVQAVFHNGSQVAGTARPDSDVDFTILVGEPDDEARVRKRLGRAFVFRGLCHEVDQYDCEGVRIACTIWPRSMADGMVGAVFHSIDGLLAHQAALQHKLVEAVAVHDPSELLSEYQQRLSQYPDALAGEVVARATGYLQEEYLDDWRFRSRFHFAYVLRDILEQIGLALYARNKRFYMPPLKRWPRDLRHLQPNLEQDLFVLIGGGEEGFESEREALSAIVERLRS